VKTKERSEGMKIITIDPGERYRVKNEIFLKGGLLMIYFMNRELKKTFFTHGYNNFLYKLQVNKWI
jgi:hypothetical protein